MTWSHRGTGTPETIPETPGGMVTQVAEPPLLCPPQGTGHRPLCDRRTPGDDGAGHYGRALDMARVEDSVGQAKRRHLRVRKVDVPGNTRKGKRPQHLAEEVPMMERAVRIGRRLDMDRRKSAFSVENRVGRAQCGRRPDVQHADARNADAPQVPSFRSPNEQWPPSPKVRKPRESPT